MVDLNKMGQNNMCSLPVCLWRRNANEKLRVESEDNPRRPPTQKENKLLIRQGASMVYGQPY